MKTLFISAVAVAAAAVLTSSVFAQTPASAGATAAPAATAKSPAATKAPAPSGGLGLVWVNSKSKTYHCPSSKSYGTTKAGSYMTEADAKAAGNHPANGEVCG